MDEFDQLVSQCRFELLIEQLMPVLVNQVLEGVRASLEGDYDQD